jgi:lycopene cyclase domain-containing protein
MYTAYTFGLLSIVLLFCFYRKINLHTITISFISILPFMFISNGLLTGMWIENEVVWYNDFQNLGFRIFTIPIEDFFYGYLLILFNVLLYEAFRNINFLNFVKK